MSSATNPYSRQLVLILMPLGVGGAEKQLGTGTLLGVDLAVTLADGSKYFGTISSDLSRITWQDMSFWARKREQVESTEMSAPEFQLIQPGSVVLYITIEEVLSVYTPQDFDQLRDTLVGLTGLEKQSIHITVMSGSVILKVVLLKSAKQQSLLNLERSRDIVIESFENGTISRLMPLFPPAFGQTDRAQQWTNWLQNNLTNLTSSALPRSMSSAPISEIRIVPQPFLCPAGAEPLRAICHNGRGQPLSVSGHDARFVSCGLQGLVCKPAVSADECNGARIRFLCASSPRLSMTTIAPITAAPVSPTMSPRAFTCAAEFTIWIDSSLADFRQYQAQAYPLDIGLRYSISAWRVVVRSAKSVSTGGVLSEQAILAPTSTANIESQANAIVLRLADDIRAGNSPIR